MDRPLFSIPLTDIELICSKYYNNGFDISNAENFNKAIREHPEVLTEDELYKLSSYIIMDHPFNDGAQFIVIPKSPPPFITVRFENDEDDLYSKITYVTNMES